MATARANAVTTRPSVFRYRYFVAISSSSLLLLLCFPMTTRRYRYFASSSPSLLLLLCFPMLSRVTRAMSSSSSSAAAAASSSPTTATKSAALIFLHGLGDSPAGWSSLATSLPRLKPRLQNVEYVFPPAPTIALSINGGMKMPGWFDLYDWPIGVGTPDDRDGKIKAVAQVNDCVSKLEAKGIPRNRIVVGGFSQGGAIALLAAYHSNVSFTSTSSASASSVESQQTATPLAGCVALSAWLTLVDDLQVPANVAKQTRLFWAHGEYDDKVLFEQQKHGIDVLKQHGVVHISQSQFPMGHESHPQEMEQLATFLDTLLFEKQQSAEQQEKEL
jgi:predicted esterase